jgi:phosphoribosylamine--glycine ligase
MTETIAGKRGQAAAAGSAWRFGRDMPLSHFENRESPFMRVLLIGSGGREDALAWALGASPLLTALYAAPGNGGICGRAACVELDIGDHAAIIAFCQSERINLVVIGPEAPLVAGLADDLAAAGIKAFGPGAAAAQLEGSKGFTKEICRDAGIPTAAYGWFDTREAALAYVAEQPVPVVIKADGLAAGKGVTIAEDREAARQAVEAIFDGAFGEAGASVVIEECLVGEEASFFALSDGKTVLPLASAQDHKRAFDGDEGPNTGGMGAYSPAPVLTDDLVAQTMREIVEPTVKALAARGTPYKGVLYAGLMITAEGPKLIEYNVRFGDPECQAMVMRLKDDLLTLLKATADGILDKVSVRWRDETALTVVMAAKGYPGDYGKGSEIRGVDLAEADEDVQVFHAGTRRDGEKLLAAGGRVLNVAALGNSVSEARNRAYAAVDMIDWPDGFCRRDIGWRAIERERQGR